MKTVYKFSKPLVQGDENEITNNEIRAITQGDGTIELQERQADGKFKSIVKAGSNFVNPNLEIINGFSTSNEFGKAYVSLLSIADNDSMNPSYSVWGDYVETVRKYLPTLLESSTKMPNVLGFVGHKTDDGGFVVASSSEALIVSVTIDSQGEKVGVKVHHISFDV